MTPRTPILASPCDARESPIHFHPPSTTLTCPFLQFPYSTKQLYRPCSVAKSRRGGTRSTKLATAPGRPALTSRGAASAQPCKGSPEDRGVSATGNTQGLWTRSSGCAGVVEDTADKGRQRAHANRENRRPRLAIGKVARMLPEDHETAARWRRRARACRERPGPLQLCPGVARQPY